MTTPIHPSALEELRLTHFKSFHQATLPLFDLTLVIGRNGSGKSNAIDGLEVLARLADGDDIRDALDGRRRESPPVRGGTQGCVPIGSDSFELGCSVRTGAELVHLDVTIRVSDDVHVVAERLWRQEDGSERDLLVTEQNPNIELSDINARYHTGRRGRNPAIPFRSSRLLTSQVGSRVPNDTDGCREVHRAADQVLTALQSVFVLDPVPQDMRTYVPVADHRLRRSGDNLSAAIAHLRHDPDRWATLLEVVRVLPEHDVLDIRLEESNFHDVMLALIERQGPRELVLPARLISDGTLRFLAFLVALLEAPATGSENGTADSALPRGQTTLVVEEIENGLHPSQAARVVQLIREESARRQVRTLATTHSPAVLSALAGVDHPAVIVCDRDPSSGISRLRSLVDLPGYSRAIAAGSLGDAVTRGVLGFGEVDVDRRQAAIQALLG